MPAERWSPASTLVARRRLKCGTDLGHLALRQSMKWMRRTQVRQCGQRMAGKASSKMNNSHRTSTLLCIVNGRFVIVTAVAVVSLLARPAVVEAPTERAETAADPMSACRSVGSAGTR